MIIGKQLHQKELLNCFSRSGEQNMPSVRLKNPRQISLFWSTMVYTCPLIMGWMAQRPLAPSSQSL